MDSREFLKKCFLFDIEINEKNELYSLGGTLGDKSFLLEPGRKIGTKELAEFDALAADGEFILGHNVLDHDLPHLKKLSAGLSILQKPVIDTLYLSPLAFPENPYHRLVKDYKLVRDSVNNPLRDAQLAGNIFLDQWQSFTQLLGKNSEIPLLYRYFLHTDSSFAGLSEAMDGMGISLLNKQKYANIFTHFLRGKVCEKAALSLVDQGNYNATDSAPLAYVIAWLSVAGGNSVLPPWVNHRFPQVSRILHQLREVACNDDQCQYCRKHHNSGRFLRDFFGFNSFRPSPKTNDGESLQQEIVEAAADNLSLFATLPTGGGKSLCYLLPALMRYQRRNLLTIVISPLQALMKDQVDNFTAQTGTGLAAALSGMLTLPERKVVHDGVRLGDIGILYVSPEQLRNHSFINTIKQREIGAWIFDEAHCLSKWGHDFRPDYLYSIRFIRQLAQQENRAVPPVQCFTATAKKDVRQEIVDILGRELGLKVTLFEGGHERSNLVYEVYPVDSQGKNETVLELLRIRYQGEGSVVIYCATKKSTEDLAELLQAEGFEAYAFHSGLVPSEKKRIQDDFIGGNIPLICATNAFGMGIDKDDVRLVIHYDIPGSLENYLQEAGRAGRDRNVAECILIFTDQDIETQFTLSSLSRLTRREIAQLLRGLRYAARGKDELVLTSGELIRQEVVDLNPEEIYDPDTRVKTAISWLERGGYLEQNENNTRVFQGTPQVRNLDEAREKINALNLSKRQQQRWLAILSAIMEDSTPSRGFSADDLASHLSFQKSEDDPEKETETQRVLRTLQDMAAQGLLNKETALTAYVRYKVKDSSKKRLQRTCTLERDFLRVLEETAPDADTKNQLEIDLRQVNQKMLDLGHDYSTPRSLNLILHGLSLDGKGIAGKGGSISIRDRGFHRFSMVLHRNWNTLNTTVKIRQQAAFQALGVMLHKIPEKSPAHAGVLVKFTLEQIVTALENDFLLHDLKDPLAAAERALTFMNEQYIIDLQQGLAIFRQAMTITLNQDKKGRSYTKRDFSPLKSHYGERNFQIHVMNEYARRAMDTINSAKGLVTSYFHDEKHDFIKRFFPGREKMLDRATSEQSYQRIVDDLHNPAQEEIVATDTAHNILVLAGPGSGKTRVVAHRIAFLLRVKRVRPSAILALCYNRSAVMALRRQVQSLVGHDFRRITTLTFHGLALRLIGRSLVGHDKGRSEIDFSELIRDAIQLLQGKSDVLGFGDGQPRDELIDRFSHILIDEYQDIDQDQYTLISLLAGRGLEKSEEKMTIMAVGDDDQNIYRFRGTNVEFIRKFHHDYAASPHYLTENYRSTATIIAGANLLIHQNRDRMKHDHPICINSGRKGLPSGSNLQQNDATGRSRIPILQVEDPVDQAYETVREIQRLQKLESGFTFTGCAVLAREWQDLDGVRFLLEKAAIPVSINWARYNFPVFSQIRENEKVLSFLHNIKTKEIRASELLHLLPESTSHQNQWQTNLRRLIDDWLEESGDCFTPVPDLLDYFYETLAEQSRSGNLGSGVFLSTVHSIKGMEFNHVFILADNWHNKQKTVLEEERRLFYVAMSRARETLHIFSPWPDEHPHSKVLTDDTIVFRKRIPHNENQATIFHYEILAMKELFLDYAGQKPQSHPVHEALRKLTTGDKLQLVKNNDRLELMSGDVVVARLAKTVTKRLIKELQNIKQVKIIALVQRSRNDIFDEKYASLCQVDSWEIPIVELWKTVT